MTGIMRRSALMMLVTLFAAGAAIAAVKLQSLTLSYTNDALTAGFKVTALGKQPSADFALVGSRVVQVTCINKADGSLAVQIHTAEQVGQTGTFPVRNGQTTGTLTIAAPNPADYQDECPPGFAAQRVDVLRYENLQLLGPNGAVLASPAAPLALPSDPAAPLALPSYPHYDLDARSGYDAATGAWAGSGITGTYANVKPTVIPKGWMGTQALDFAAGVTGSTAVGMKLPAAQMGALLDLGSDFTILAMVAGRPDWETAGGHRQVLHPATGYSNAVSLAHKTGWPTRVVDESSGGTRIARMLGPQVLHYRHRVSDHTMRLGGNAVPVTDFTWTAQAAQGSQDHYIGTTPGQAFWPLGAQLYRYVIYPGTYLSDAETETAVAYLSQQHWTSGKIVAIEGNSNVTEALGYTNWATTLYGNITGNSSTGTPFPCYDFAVSSSSWDYIRNGFSSGPGSSILWAGLKARLAKLALTGRPVLVILHEHTNTMKANDAAANYAEAIATCQAVKALSPNFKTLLVGPIPTNSMNAWGPTYATKFNDSVSHFNAAFPTAEGHANIYTGAVSGVDYYCRPQGHPAFDHADDYSYTTYYDADGIHLNNTGRSTLIGLFQTFVSDWLAS